MNIIPNSVRVITCNNLKLSCFDCYNQSDLSKKVITILFISLDIHDIGSLACDPYWRFFRSPMPRHVRDVIIITLSLVNLNVHLKVRFNHVVSEDCSLFNI
jgi:hypothetical protein